MTIKKGQVWEHPHGYIFKVDSYNEKIGKWLMKVCYQGHYFYATSETILGWKKLK